MPKSNKKTTTVAVELPPCPYRTVNAESAANRVRQTSHDTAKIPTLTDWCKSNFPTATAPSGENFKRYRGKLRHRFVHGKNTSWHATADVLKYLAETFPLFRLSTDKTVRDIAVTKHGKIS